LVKKQRKMAGGTGGELVFSREDFETSNSLKFIAKFVLPFCLSCCAVLPVSAVSLP
jgi:hypothetical protein